MKTDHNLLSILKQANYKLTTSRREIVQALSDHPSTAQEILENLRKNNISTDLVTVYRNLSLLIKLGIVSKIHFGDKTARFELLKNNNHHHHLICERCGLIEDMPLNENLLMKQIKEKSTFKISRHTLEFFGFCAKCQ